MSQLKVKKPSKIEELKAMSKKDRNAAIGDLLMNNAMFIIIAIAVPMKISLKSFILKGLPRTALAIPSVSKAERMLRKTIHSVLPP